MSTATARQGRHQQRGTWITSHKRLAIYLRDGMACVYCGIDLRDGIPSDLTLDHLVPRSCGGSNDAQNLVLACRSCNCSRGDRDWREFASGESVERIEHLRFQSLNIELARAIIAGTAPGDDVEVVR